MNKGAAQAIAAAIFIFGFVLFMKGIGSVETRSHTYTVGDTVYTSSTSSGLLGSVKCEGSSNANGGEVKCE